MERPPDENGQVSKLWLLWRERRLLWGVAWKAAILSVVIAFALPKHYLAVTKVVPGETSNNSMMGMLGKLTGGAGGGIGAGLDAAGLLGMKTPGAFYVEVLKSRTVQDRIIDRFDLRRRYWKFGIWGPHTYYQTRKKLASFTDIEEDKKSGVITIEVVDYDSRTAAQIANAYVEELNRLAADLNTSDAHREREFLETRLKSAKQDLDEASMALSRFSSSNTFMDPGTQSRAMVDAAAKVQGEIIATEAELKDREQIYAPDNVRVRSLRARLAELEGQLRKITGNGGHASESASDSGGTSTTADSGGTPSTDASMPFPSMKKLPLLGYRYSDYYRQAKIQEAVYEFLTQQYEMARIQEAKELPTVRVMDMAVPPERKNSPIRSLIVVLSILGSLILASFWIVGRNAWEQIPVDDPRRVLAAEMSETLTQRFKRRSPRGR
jgi:uncharacterized protein involved in exopolysaccharide biosynthesis